MILNPYENLRVFLGWVFPATRKLPTCRQEGDVKRKAPEKSPSYCCGARQKRRLAKQACFLPTAATRSGRLFRHRRRSHRSPFRTQKLSSFVPTIVAG